MSRDLAVLPKLEAAALRFLAQREHGHAELIAKLCQRYPDARAQAVLIVAALNEKGYQSDLRFAQAFLRARMQRGYGPRAIAFMLQQKGVEKPLISRCIADYSVVDWVAVMQSWWAKHAGRKIARHSGAMWIKRGFYAEHVQYWMKETAKNK